MFSYIKKNRSMLQAISKSKSAEIKEISTCVNQMKIEELEECPANRPAWATQTSNGSVSSNSSQEIVSMSMNEDSDEDQSSSQQSVAIKNNYFPAPDSCGSNTGMSGSEIEIDEDETDEEQKQAGYTIYDNQATADGHGHDDGDDGEIMSYDQITAMLGDDTTSSDYLSNLFDEEKKVNASTWFTLDKYTKSVKRMRNAQLEWIRNTSESFGLLDSTTFRAIYYFDRICAVKLVNPAHIAIMSACCLNIAAKFNDKEKYTPTVEEVANACNYSVESMITSELQIMRALDFKLKIVLPIDFIKYYIYEKRAIFADDELNNHSSIQNIDTNAKIIADLEKFAVFFLHIMSQSYGFYQFKSSTMAMAVLCAARRAMQIKPYNHSKLGEFYVGDSKEVNACFDRLWSKYHHRFPKNAQKYQQYQPKATILL